MMTNPPTPLGMAVDLAGTGVYADADCTDECRFAEVRTEAGPKVVVQVRSTVECAGVKRKPMSYDIEEGDEERNADHEKEEEQAECQPPVATAPGFGLDSLAAAADTLGQRS
jgi:hypothetical protein